MLLHAALKALEFLGFWTAIALAVGLVVGPRLRDRQPADHCKHTNTPGGH